MLYILLFALGIHYGLGQVSSSLCQIKFPFSSNYISAFYEQDILGVGCSTNSTTSSEEQVHVIDLLNAGPILRNDVGEVYLNIKSRNEEVLWKKPLIFVLNSHQPVRWKVRMEILALIKIKHIFVVPRHSGVKIMKGPVKIKGKVRKVDHLPNERDKLLKWTLDEYEAITSFTQLKKGNRILLDVGIDKTATSKCKIKEGRQRLNAVAKYERPQILHGCSVPARSDPMFRDRVAFVVELDRVHAHTNPGTISEVEFDIKGDRRKVIQQNFLLVLKSPQNVQWKVKTRKVQGSIDIIANTDTKNVNMEDIRMDTVGVRAEDMTDTGQELIKWVEYYIGPVALYARVEMANKIKLVLPEADVKPGVTVVIDPFEQPNSTKAVFKSVIRTECHPQSGMTVAISKNIIQSFDLSPDQLTFLSPSCKTTENHTHVLLDTSATGCRTRMVEKHGKEYFTNKLLIHQTKINNDVIERGSGDSSDEEISGSGSHDPMMETYIDDEDFSSSVIKIDVACEISDITIIDPEQTSQSLPRTTPPNVGFRLELYKSSAYHNPYPYDGSIAVPVNSRLYAQASINTGTDENYRVQVQNCSISPNIDFHTVDHHLLLQHGCEIDSSFRWHSMPSSQRQRFSFVPGMNRKFFYLHCRLTVCKLGRFIEQNGIPQCVSSPTEHCNQASYTSGSNVLSQVVVLEPTREHPTVDPKPRKTTTTTEKTTVKQKWHLNTKNKEDKPTKAPEQHANSETFIVEGLDSGSVVGIAFAAFIIGIILMAALWFIHTHTGPIKHAVASRGLDLSGESTPSSTAPIHT